MTEARGALWKTIATAAAAALLVSVAGFLVTDLSDWYYTLRKPSWQPPDWLFGPVWTTIFSLAAVSAVLAWRHTRSPTDRFRVMAPFTVNAVLNVMWSWLFFTLHRPDIALIEVVALWLSVAFVFWGLWPLSRIASWLLAPYLVWVAFAGYLNLTIVRLNAPFAAS